MSPRGCRLHAWVSALLLAAPLANGQAAVAIHDEQAAEQKHDGFSVRKEAPKFNDALDDFARYRDKKAWELAFRSLETLAEAKRDGMVPAGKGFFVPSRLRVLQSLTSLPADGKQAFKLFYDAKAKQLFERAEAASKTPSSAGSKAPDEIASLREIYEKYFISSVGDRAADRLGDAFFETGDFTAAAGAWNAILKDFPDTSIPRLRLHIKRCTALARAGHWELFDEAARQVRSEYAGERLTVAGREVVATDYLESLRGAATRPTTNPSMSAAAPTGPVDLPRDDKPAWQIKLLDEPLNKKLQAAFSSNNWGSQFSTLRTAVPSSAADGKRIYVNWLGIVFAADVETGKLVWRNRKFSELGDKFQNFINMMADTDCYTVTAGPSDRLFVTGINLDRLNNYQEPVRLVCMNSVDGKVKWSSNAGALSSWSIVGTPVPYEDIVYVAARQSQGMDVSLLALGAEKGDLLWQVLLGTAQAGTNYRGLPDVPSPVILPAGGSIYVVTNNGALLAIDVAARRVDWAYTYDGTPVNNRQTWWNGEAPVNRPKMFAHAFIDGATLYLKEEAGDAIHAVDLTGPSLVWRRPLDRDNSIQPIPGSSRLLVTGQDLGAIDAKSQMRPLQWNTPLPQLIGRINPLIAGEHVLAFSPRGIFEVSMSNGDTVRILRGADKESIGGDLRRAPGRLISVSNLAITAYPVSDLTQQAKGQ